METKTYEIRTEADIDALPPELHAEFAKDALNMLRQCGIMPEVIVFTPDGKGEFTPEVVDPIKATLTFIEGILNGLKSEEANHGI